jgi:cysteinyl-tRNA synthetase
VTAEVKIRDYVALADLYCDFAAARLRRPHDAIVEALADNLNTHAALVIIDRMAGQSDLVTDMAVGLDFLGILSLDKLEAKVNARRATVASLGTFADRLAALREEAMKTKDFGPVDALKSKLQSAGVQVQMSKSGIELLPGPNFDVDTLKDI